MAGYTKPYVTCPGCGKRGYFTRKAAKAAARAFSLRGLNAYRCALWPEELWHLGHLPDLVRDGKTGRNSLGYTAPRPEFHRGDYQGEKKA